MSFFTAKKRIDARRRYGSRDFQTKVKEAKAYKRVFDPNPAGFFTRALFMFGLRSKATRYLVAVVFIVAFYFLVISSDLLIKDIAVSGNYQVSTDQILNTLNEQGNRRVFLIKQNNYFLFTRGRANGMLVKNIPYVKEIVQFNKSWPSRASIEIRERAPVFVLKANNRMYLVDEDGMVMTEVTIEPKNLFIVEDQVIEDYGIMENLPNPKLFAFIISTQKQWNSKISSPIVLVKIPGKASGEVQFVSAEGWGVFFDISRPVLSQVGNLALILSREIPASRRTQLAYIDLRLSKWAYYCYKNSPCEVKPQQPAEEQKPVEANK